jgi:hypothetical protein
MPTDRQRKKMRFMYRSLLKAIPVLVLLPCVLLVGPLIAMSVFGYLALNGNLPGTRKYPPDGTVLSAFRSYKHRDPGTRDK